MDKMSVLLDELSTKSAKRVEDLTVGDFVIQEVKSVVEQKYADLSEVKCVDLGSEDDLIKAGAKIVFRLFCEGLFHKEESI